MEVSQKVPQYISDSSDEEVEIDNNDMQQNKEIKKRQTRYWVKEAEFSNTTESISQTELKKYINKKWTTVNQFKKSCDIWCLEMHDDSNWKTSKCNCPAFLKNCICKHIVRMAIRLKYCKSPAAAKTVPINSKQKRGRPAKAKPALLVQ